MVKAELEALFRIPRQLDKKFDPMSVFRYDNDKGFKFDLVRRLAITVLGCPAGEAPSERIFSIASRILGQTRASLSPQALSDALFLKKNKTVWV